MPGRRHIRAARANSFNPDILQAAAAIRGNLWIAGGLNPGNVSDVVFRWHPDLVDVSAAWSSLPGKKDHQAIRQFVSAAKKR